MQSIDLLEEHVYDLILDLCTVLYNNGYRAVPLGAMMRIIGVADEYAAEHDHEVFELDEEFKKILEDKKGKSGPSEETCPPGVTLH